MDKKATGELIRAARTEKGYTQSELGNILGVSNKAVSRWENGDSFPDIGILENLSSTLNIEIGALITGEKNNAPSTHMLHELLRIAKIQAVRKSQSFIWGIAGAIILIFLLISGYLTMIANHISLPWLLYYGSLLLFSIFFVVKSKIQVQSFLPSETKTRKLIPTILIALSLYQIVSYGLICLSTTSEPLARLLQNLPLGFLLNLQLIAGYLIGLSFINHYLYSEHKSAVQNCSRSSSCQRTGPFMPDLFRSATSFNRRQSVCRSLCTRHRPCSHHHTDNSFSVIS